MAIGQFKFSSGPVTIKELALGPKRQLALLAHINVVTGKYGEKIHSKTRWLLVATVNLTQRITRVPIILLF